MKLRIARSTSKLKEIVEMYRTGLDFSIVGSFENHAGFSGVMLGHPGSPYHFEFTQEEQAQSQPVPHPESLIVFYEPDEEKFSALILRMNHAGFKKVKSHNPYWDEHGATFEDLEKHLVVISR